MKKPNFFIVGAPKCGTTALYNLLKQNKGVFLTQIKEPQFFGKDLPFQNDWYQGKLNKYLDLYSQAEKEKAVGEASTCYFYSDSAAEEIKKFNPKAKIIIMLRNPVDMMYSLHSELLFHAAENIKDFKKALEAEKDRSQNKLKVRIKNKKVFQYQNIASYSRWIEKYIKAFGRKNVLIIIFEEFKKHPEKTYKQTLRFLGINYLGKINIKTLSSNKTRNSNKIPKNNLLLLLINRQPLWLRSFILSVFPLTFLSKIHKVFTRLNTTYVPRPKLSQSLKTTLMKEFRPEIRKLEKLLSTDLSIWG